MVEQNYANHRFSPKLANAASVFWALAFGAGTRYWWMNGHPVELGVAMFSGLVCLFLAVAMSRVYVTALQDRIIKLEMRLRVAKCLDSKRQADLQRLRKSQLVALRFASDEEMPALLDRIIAENLTAEQIKKAIRVWIPDWDRT